MDAHQQLSIHDSGVPAPGLTVVAAVAVVWAVYAAMG